MFASDTPSFASSCRLVRRNQLSLQAPLSSELPSCRASGNNPLRRSVQNAGSHSLGFRSHTRNCRGAAPVLNRGR